MRARMQRGSGNVFRDLGFGSVEAEQLRMRAELMLRLTKVIRDRRLTQARAAKLFGVSQPRVSDLVRDRIERFSIDTLIGMLNQAGSRSRSRCGAEYASPRTAARCHAWCQRCPSLAAAGRCV